MGNINYFSLKIKAVLARKVTHLVSLAIKRGALISGIFKDSLSGFLSKFQNAKSTSLRFQNSPTE